jgi:hypothetical protein
MRFLRASMLVAAGVVVLASSAWAQRMGMGGNAPLIPGEFKPVVGNGAEYQIQAKKETMNWEYAIVGKEDADGKDAYWMEIRMKSPKGPSMIMKQLMVLEGDTPEIKRMIMQTPGQEPMEMPVGMMSGMMKRMQQSAQDKSGSATLGEKIGTETVTVPAGTFECDHYRSNYGGKPADSWISTKVFPYGLVKLTSSDTSMVLDKVLENQTSQITGEPRKFEMPHF